ncbi:MAG: hypothetical protein AAGA70_06390 [Pseudomonadota bacterium]
MVEYLGYLAAALVLLQTSMRQMLALRVFALASNLVFITYGYLGDLEPVMFLHLMLLPLNTWQIWALVRPEHAETPMAANLPSAPALPACPQPDLRTVKARRRGPQRMRRTM